MEFEFAIQKIMKKTGVPKTIGTISSHEFMFLVFFVSNFEENMCGKEMEEKNPTVITSFT